MTYGTTRDGRLCSKRAEMIQRRYGALGALRITLAGQTTGEVWAGRPAEAEACYLEAAEISALIGVPTPATTGVLLELRAWQGREQESRALAEMTAQWGQQRGAAVLEVFAWMGLTVLELGLGRYAEALGWGMRIYDDDPPGFGNRVLPDDRRSRRSGAARTMPRTPLWPAWLSARRPAAPPGPWACWPGHARCWPARPRPSLSTAQALAHLGGTLVSTELARSQLLYGEWLRRRKRRRDARSQLRAACAAFDAMGAAAFARRTRAELLAAGDRPDQPAERPGLDLTPQEAQVSRLAAAGATNAEIAYPSVRHHLDRRISPQQGLQETRHHLPPPARRRPDALTDAPGAAGRSGPCSAECRDPSHASVPVTGVLSRMSRADAGA